MTQQTRSLKKNQFQGSASTHVGKVKCLVNGSLTGIETHQHAKLTEGFVSSLQPRCKKSSRENFGKWICQMLDEDVRELHMWPRGDQLSGIMFSCREGGLTNDPN